MLALGAGAGTGESRGGGEDAGGDASSFGGAGGGEVASAGGFWSSGEVGPEGTGGAAGSSEGGGDVGRGGKGSSFGGGEVGRGGDVGKGGAGDSGGGGEAGRGGAGSTGGTGGRSGDSALKQTHESPVSSPAGGGFSGPKMLSKSAIEGFLLEPSASVDTSETQTTNDHQRPCVQRSSVSLQTEIKHGRQSDREVRARKFEKKKVLR